MYSMPEDRDPQAGDKQCLTTSMSNTDFAQNNVYYSTPMDLSSKTHAVTDAMKRAKFDPVKNDYLVAVEDEYSNSAIETIYVELPVATTYSITEQETSGAAQNQYLTTAKTNLGVRPVDSEYTIIWGGPSEATDNQLSPICGTDVEVKVSQSSLPTYSIHAGFKKLKWEELALTFVRHSSTWEEYLDKLNCLVDKFNCLVAKCRERKNITLEKSGLATTAPNHLANRKLWLFSFHGNTRGWREVTERIFEEQ